MKTMFPRASLKLSPQVARRFARVATVVLCVVSLFSVVPLANGQDPAPVPYAESVSLRSGYRITFYEANARGSLSAQISDAQGRLIPGSPVGTGGFASGAAFELIGTDGSRIPSLVRDARGVSSRLEHLYDPATLSQQLPVTVNAFLPNGREVTNLGTLTTDNLQLGRLGTARSGPSDGVIPGVGTRTGNPSPAGDVRLGPASGRFTPPSSGGNGGPGSGGSGGGNSLVPCIGEPCTLFQLFDLGRNIFNLLLALGAVAAIAAVVAAGFSYVLARGDAGKLSDAKQKLMFAIIGPVVLLAAVASVNPTPPGRTPDPGRPGGKGRRSVSLFIRGDARYT